MSSGAGAGSGSGRLRIRPCVAPAPKPWFGSWILVCMLQFIYCIKNIDILICFNYIFNEILSHQLNLRVNRLLKLLNFQN